MTCQARHISFMEIGQIIKCYEGTLTHVLRTREKSVEVSRSEFLSNLLN